MKVFRNKVNKFELANNKEHIDIKYILASSIPNFNGALFTEEELEAAEKSIVNEPLIIVPSFINLPTGHSVTDFPKLGDDAKIIGTHIASELQKDGDVTHLVTTARVWKIRHPEIAQEMEQLHDNGELTFSMECHYNHSEVAEGGVRALKGVKFIGSAVVDDPANPFSYSLEVANKHKQGGHGKMTLEEALQKIGQMEAAAKTQSEELKKVVADLEVAQKAKKELEAAKATLTETLETANKNLEAATEQVKAFETEKAEKEKAELAEKRFTEMAQFVKFEEAEVAAKKESFAGMSEDIFALVLETAKRSQPAGNSEFAGITSDTKIDLSGSKGFLDGIEND
ncbi:hypothetical protein CPT_Stills33 [Bacillus phage Stills]|uniref:Uncharacterized protein n=1 Tax=Bacillus phage Stills TaxID=1610833 RepID=A0A0E3T5J7_9CAUD|nr:hypothetical protein CPT_Stills33 [Bacillus phage Stills]AKC02661.1 hypothetical protein CPT_Stills33 [Bacillus phage Stills]